MNKKPNTINQCPLNQNPIKSTLNNLFDIKRSNKIQSGINEYAQLHESSDTDIEMKDHAQNTTIQNPMIKNYYPFASIRYDFNKELFTQECEYYLQIPSFQTKKFKLSTKHKIIGAIAVKNEQHYKAIITMLKILPNVETPIKNTWKLSFNKLSQITQETYQN